MLDAPALRQILARLTLLPSHDPTDDLVRLIVQSRARDACEYCLMPTRSLFHVDHIVPSARWAEYLEAERLIEQLVSDRGANHIDNFAGPARTATRQREIESRAVSGSARFGCSIHDVTFGTSTSC